MSKSRADQRVIAAPVTDRYAERTAFGWQWQAGGRTFTVQWHRRQRQWVAREDGGRRSIHTTGPSVAAATAGWPVEARAVFRRTLRPLGIA